MILISLKNLQDQNNQFKKTKALTLKNEIILLNERKKVCNAFESGIFSKRNQGHGLASISDLAACVARVAKVCDRRILNHKQLNILTPK